MITFPLVVSDAGTDSRIYALGHGVLFSIMHPERKTAVKTFGMAYGTGYGAVWTAACDAAWSRGVDRDNGPHRHKRGVAGTGFGRFWLLP
ncbi:hypothetical protein HEQ60_06305 [Haematospirillum sp. H1815]|uniref:hypothetical protein n=1 Tax=Haematospirillum sp. H1815 TaxID=2723108 RepID=UPI00143C1AEC|nr:hypothetical protein [Haematospirillum sp. H1815]NKD77370.1 hypothetical protein [Haematospirillum sp. H1815]